MKRAAIPREHRALLRYFYGIVAFVSAAATLLVVSVYLTYTADYRSRDVLELFHTRSLTLTHEISTSLARLQKEPVVPQNSYGRPSEASARATSALAPISKALSSVVALQLNYSDPTFVGTVERARRRHDRIRQALASGTISATDLSCDLDAFGLSIRQLHQLHSIAIENALRDLTAGGHRRAWILALLIGLVLVVTWTILTKLLRLLRARLHELEQTKEALLERERQLQQSQKMQAIGTLVGGVAHDFNNLLTAILGNADLLLMKLAADDSRRSYAEGVRLGSKRAAALTRQLLTFSRFDMVEPRIIDLNLIVRQMEPLLRRLIPADIRLLVECEDDVGSIRVDPVQMEQVLVNLITNARDALSSGGTLTIQTGHVDVRPEEAGDLGMPPGRYSQLTVDDDGCGMTPEVRSRVFEPFFTTKERDRGTGLGLSTVHGIVTKSDGYLLVDSEPGRGSRLVVYLPCQDIAAGDTDPVPDVAAVPKGSETLLVVEDQEQVRQLTAAGLRAHGYRVLTCGDGHIALRMFRADPAAIDLVLTDVILPRISGPQLVHELRDIRPDIRVVYVSGYSKDATLKDVQDSDDSFMTKPFTLDELLRLVRRELDRSHSHEAA